MSMMAHGSPPVLLLAFEVSASCMVPVWQGAWSRAVQRVSAGSLCQLLLLLHSRRSGLRSQAEAEALTFSRSLTR